MSTDAERHAEGLRIRRAVLGAQHVDRAIAATTPETAAFQDYITRTAWGDVWARDGLDRRSRSLITLAALTALSHDNELALHIRGALANGLSRAEVAETLLHTAVYAGVPAANRAMGVLRQVFADLDGDRAPDG